MFGSALLAPETFETPGVKVFSVREAGSSSGAELSYRNDTDAQFTSSRDGQGRIMNKQAAIIIV